MKKNYLRAVAAFLFFLILTVGYSVKVAKNTLIEASVEKEEDKQKDSQFEFDRQIRKNAQKMIKEGRQIFRFDTFGDEGFWGDALKLHRAIAGAKLGGVGPGVSPKTALAVGLKVDMEMLPRHLIEALKHGKVDLDDPATTLALLKLNAVLGVTGFFNEQGGLRSMGIQCALCHSTVNDSVAFGMVSGWMVGPTVTSMLVPSCR